MGRKLKIKASRNKAKDVETKPRIPPRVMPPNHQQMLQFLDQCIYLSPIDRGKHIQAQQFLRQIGEELDELAKLKQAKKE